KMTTQVEPSQVESTQWESAAKPPITERGIIGWLYHNLFSSIANTILTLITLAVLYLGISGLVRWIANAYWEPVWVNRELFAVGPDPAAALNQPLHVLLALCLLFGLSAGRWGSIMRNIGIGLAALLAVLVVIPIGINTQLMLAGALVLLVLGYIVGLVR